MSMRLERPTLASALAPAKGAPQIHASVKIGIRAVILREMLPGTTVVGNPGREIERKTK
ncbi:MAG: hypothetical protein J0I07_16160 [Myxococcales bacterium]|nr:hypothetical protein [Myxococcales bacterium]